MRGASEMSGARFCGSVFGDDDGDGELAGMGEREGEVADAEAGSELGGAAGEMQSGTLAGEAQHLELGPGDPAADACAEGLRGGFFGGETGGEAFGGGLPFLAAIGDLGGRVDAVEEGVAVASERVLDAGDLDPVGAEAEDHVCEFTCVSQIESECGTRVIDFSAGADRGGDDAAELGFVRVRD